MLRALWQPGLRAFGRSVVSTAIKRSVSATRCLSTVSAEGLVKQVAAADEETQAAVLAALSAETKKQASLKWMVEELEQEFARADINTDGTLSYNEFQQWAREVVERNHSPGEVKVPATSAQLRALAAQTMVPYVGFGVVDNAMMVMSGEAIDHTLGLMLGLSTLAAAALGNSFSNGAWTRQSVLRDV